MIKLDNLNNTEPYKIFEKKYYEAQQSNQNNIEAILISSFSKRTNEVDSRYVNLKYIIDDEWIFFTNYDSPKAKQFIEHSQISAVFYWNSTNTQIRLKAKIKKTNEDFSDEHFENRLHDKNVLAIISNQSSKIDTYSDIQKKYNEQFDQNNQALSRPSYWGGFSFKPYYFEFWEGHKSRLNKREAYSLMDNQWKSYYLEP